MGIWCGQYTVWHLMTPKVFGIDYQFLSCGQVFTDGLANAAPTLGIEYQHSLWNSGVLMQRLAEFKPDLLFVTHGRRFARQWRGQFSQYRSALWSLDDPYEVDDVTSFSGDFSHVFVCDPTTLHRHRHASYLPVCYDPFVHTDQPGPRPYAVGFIGGQNPVRNTFLAALAAKGMLSYVVGGPFCDPVQRLSKGHNIPPSATAGFYRQTQIVINVFRSEHHFNRLNIPATSANPRVYEATACGALVVSEWRPELDTLCPEMPTFRTPEECIEKVTALLAHPAALLATRDACQARLKDHTYAARLNTVLLEMGLRQPVCA